MRPGRSVSPLPRRRSALRGFVTAASIVVAIASSPMAAQARDILTVTMDKAKLVKYPAATETIIVGNPIIADVTMLRASGLLVVTGKGFGETNLLLLDRNGTILSDANLRVESSDALVTLQRGTDRETYACHPRCEPTIAVGDTTAFFTNAETAITSRNNLAVPTGGGSAGGGGGGAPH